MFITASGLLRDDFLWLLPAVLIALFQVKIIWARLPKINTTETEIDGCYKDWDITRLLYFTYLTYFFLFVQLVVTILPISSFTFTRFLGYGFVIFGFINSFVALKTINTNWTGMFQYRIKKGQKLITKGPYGFIRHPIYTSAILEIAGFELIANSWLFAPMLVFGYFMMYQHSLKEEALLEKKFGEEFKEYKRKTKMFIPFIF
ncbi:MAG: hypothetical protein A3D24_00555 [Candidatus Blackburnbacteria bacterium RIFCSPHIGHO2_02_FULL_39_13]|uniref:Steroid 5-alpha reductase C-terminal domain-containing protein n=1 Tax=Candidatus Blackburnbacteria bacterium RIFCSPLOWO2_01_FULL_40_20 TaxID=1797519 RepID=A0A1G1VFP7_9BACT|nr:MAG: Isoprenylcysteine carboxyl methyltransferase [Microgenomates group bacterium GW2011_GWA2_39_19]OGY07566.1 MAG: hypothetical protein A2694_04905 [Candidatus Blackburnbacteria bacterium RIFCSPHIGHO2_01_FULL_40_17]OGY08649.1 MAG: hypothetical protein A3D24_00555 [Candidatus Blackburnbacteria bacterium RIFCSPHIGHO2_02_FULL_39_13]OGY14283.1 MAG: hypothetical protein A3A77_02300 [Candidatus Blackburnbacteria bacterium RIFCSPLOWO2_01_FULL_40_20]OGY14610.1 MAG: hypothetical protein A3I52_00510 